MSCTIGRASLTTNPYNLSLSGKTLSFSIDIVGATVGEMTFLRQQLCGYVNNGDEPTVPFTWSEDSTLDGFYTNVQVTIPSTINMLNSFFIQTCQVSMEQIPGFANPLFEVTTEAFTRVNGIGITAPVCVQVAGFHTGLDAQDWAGLRTATFSTRTTEDGSLLTVGTAAAPNGPNMFRFSSVPASFYVGACKIEVLDGAVWRTVVGKEPPRNTVWRISNGLVRITSANGATSGKFEVWDNTAVAWESQNIRHYISTGTINGIGRGNGTTQAYVTVVRNSVERVVVSCSAPLSSGSVDSLTVTYSLTRGAAHVEVGWTATGSGISFGPMFTSATACSATTGGIIQTTAVAGNKLLLLLPVTPTTDLVNGSIYNTTTGTLGQHAFMVDMGAYGEYFGSVSWVQRVIVK